VLYRWVCSLLRSTRRILDEKGRPDRRDHNERTDDCRLAINRSRTKRGRKRKRKKGTVERKSNNKQAIVQLALLAIKMRFRSLVVSWCVCAIHGSVQIASEHRSHDTTSRSTYHPSSDIVYSPKNILNLLSSLFPVSKPRSPSRYTVDAISKSAGIDEKKHRIPLKLNRVMDNREKIVESFAKRRLHRKRRKKCRCRKRGSRRRIGSLLLRSETTRELNELPIVKNLFTSVGEITNVPASILNPTSESTAKTSTPQHFTDIAFTTTDAVPPTVNAKMIMEAAKITAKIAPKKIDDVSREIYQWKSHRKRCKKIKCVTKNCKKKRKEKMNVIDVVDQAFFQDNLGNVRVSPTKMPSSTLENVNL